MLTLSKDDIKKIRSNPQKNLKANLASKYSLSEEFIEEFQNYLDWEDIFYYQKLSPSIIKKFSERVNWESISCRQKLPEDLIKEFSDKVNWSLISQH